MVRVLLVDDEKHALDILQILLGEIGNVEVAGAYTDALQAVEELQRTKVDAVFLDIEMPGMTGMDAAKAIKAIDPALQIVFTTAYSDYAIEAFEIQSLDYLLKPIRKERLLESVKRIEQSVSGYISKGSVYPMLNCMGSFYVRLSDRENTRLLWRTHKEKELCAFLVYHCGKVVDQAVIIETLWPESNFEKARAYLYTCISWLKKNLRSSGMKASLKKVDKGYALDIGDTVCDVLDLQEVIEQILSGKGMSTQQLERITALYKGEYLGDCDYGWALGKRSELSTRYLQAMRKLYEFFKSNGAASFALECMRCILKVSPESEQDGRELIRLHMEAGNRNEAIKSYRQLEQAVRVHLDVELEEETVKLYRQIVSSYGS